MHTTGCLSTHLLINILVVPSLGLLQIKLPGISVYKCLHGHMILFNLPKFLKVQWLDHMGCACLTFEETAPLFTEMATPLCISSEVYENSSGFPSLSTLSMVSFKNLNHFKSICGTSLCYFHFPND